MTHLFHTLYVNQNDLTLNLSNKALVVLHEDGRQDHIPLNTVENIVIFTQVTMSDAVMDYCATNHIGICFLNKRGRFRYRIIGDTHGNVLLRKAQYLLSEKEEALPISKSMIGAKIRNELFVIQKFQTNHPLESVDVFQEVATAMKQVLLGLPEIRSEEVLRGMEGIAARYYFEAFGKMVLTKEPDLQFAGRNRRPPKDCCNALLSFVYSLLMIDCIQALESIGLDPYVGFMHKDRSGRASLALDLMEEFRPLIVDRFVLKLLNLNMIKVEMFDRTEDGVYLNNIGKNLIFKEWNHMKKQEIAITGIEKPVWKRLLPYVQAQRVARYIMQEDNSYQPIIGR